MYYLSRSQFTSLPLETIHYILDLAGTVATVRCTQTCRLLKSIVRSSKHLSESVESHRQVALHDPALDFSTILSIWSKPVLPWNGLFFRRRKCVIPASLPSGPFVAFSVVRNYCIYISLHDVHILTFSRGSDYRDSPTPQMRRFGCPDIVCATINVAQGMLVMFASSRRVVDEREEEYTFTLYFVSLEKPDPPSKSIRITLRCVPSALVQTGFQSCGDYVGLLQVSGSQTEDKADPESGFHSTLLIANWRLFTMGFCRPRYPPHAFCFVDGSHLLYAALHAEKLPNGTPVLQPRLHILHLIKNGGTKESDLILRYPFLPGHTMQQVQIGIKTDYSRADRCERWEKANYSTFDSGEDWPSHGLVVVTITVASSRTYHHIIPVRVIQSTLRMYTRGLHPSERCDLEWLKWTGGATATTLLKDPYSFYGNAPHVHGSRVMLSNKIGQFQVLDFNLSEGLAFFRDQAREGIFRDARKGTRNKSRAAEDDLLIDPEGKPIVLVRNLFFTHSTSTHDAGPRSLVDGVYFADQMVVWHHRKQPEHQSSIMVSPIKQPAWYNTIDLRAI